MASSIADENILVSNQGKHPLVNFNFMLRVELLFDLPCKSVHAFSRELEYDYIQEGGLNDYVHMRRKPISKPFTLEVERYVGIDYFDPLPLGADLVLPVMLFVSRYASDFIPFVVARTYVFTGCTVMKKIFGELVGDKAGLLVETTTLAYREMLCVDIPWSMAAQKYLDNDVDNATNALAAAESLERIKALSQAAYNKIKDAAKESTAALADIKEKIVLIPAALTKATDVTAAALKSLNIAQEGLTPKQSALKTAQNDAAAKRKAANEKRLEMDKAYKELTAAQQESRSAGARLKETENAAKAAKWKVDSLSKQSQAAEDAAKDAKDAVTTAKDAVTTAKAEADKSKFSKSLKEAEAAKTAAEIALAAAKTGNDKAQAGLTAAKSAYAPVQTAYNAAKSALDTSEKAVAAKQTELAAAEADIKSKQQLYGRARGIEAALSAAEKSSKIRQSSSEALVDLIPEGVSECNKKNNSVQAAEDLDEAHKHYPEVQSNSSDVRKALDTIKSNQTYFANCLKTQAS